jgi:hypothetical protein
VKPPIFSQLVIGCPNQPTNGHGGSAAMRARLSKLLSEKNVIDRFQ